MCMVVSTLTEYVSLYARLVQRVLNNCEPVKGGCWLTFKTYFGWVQHTVAPRVLAHLHQLRFSTAYHVNLA